MAGRSDNKKGKTKMEVIVLLIIVAVLFGLGGLLTAAKWLLIIAVALIVAGAILGYLNRGGV